MGIILGGSSASDLILDGKSVSLYVGGNPPVKVWPTREVVQITLGTGLQARDQFRAALADRGLAPWDVVEIPFDIELVGTGSAQYMFDGCSSLTSVPNMDTSGVTNMNSMFMSCSALTSVPDMDTSSVTDMNSMFMSCSSLTYVPDMDTSSVTDMGWMFYGCAALASVPAMDTSSVTDMEGMFYGCAALTSVPAMYTSQVTDMNSMFSDCRSLASVPAMDTAQVTDMNSMFYNCSALTTVPAMDTAQVTDMNSMFMSCSSLTYVPDMDTAQVTNMASMFNGCSALTSVPDMHTSQVTNMLFMFYNCASLTDGNVLLIGKHPNVNTDLMITGSGLTKEPFIEVVQITLATGPRVQYQLREALTARGLSYRNVTELPFRIDLVGSGETTSLFDGFSALTKVPAMDTSQVTGMRSMFNGCSSLTTVPPMDTSKVTSMYYMFYGCSALASVPPMDTSKVTEAQYMFNRCSALTDENVRLIGKNPSVDTMNMLKNSGLTKEPFYATDRLPNPPAPRVVTISKQGYTSQWDTSSATGDVSLIQEWTSNGSARFAAYVTCNEEVYYGGSYASQKPGAVIPSGVDVEPHIRNVYTFTEVI